MALMTLKCGVVVQLDEQDVDLVFGLSWTLTSDKKYAVNRKLGRWVFMHRLIMQPERGMVVDHIDGNGLNNRRSNLRICTQQQNIWNHRDAASAGVRFYKGKWRAHIFVNGSQYSLGGYDEYEHARQARDWVARRLRGEFAPEFKHNVSFDPSAFPKRVRDLLV